MEKFLEKMKKSRKLKREVENKDFRMFLSKVLKSFKKNFEKALQKQFVLFLKAAF